MDIKNRISFLGTCRRIHSYRTLCAIAIAILGFVTPSLVTAVEITLVRVANGQAFPDGTRAGAQPANALGGGSFDTVLRYAAAVWSAHLMDRNVNVTISYGWAPLTGTTLAHHSLLNQGGNPNRETQGMIQFDNDGSSVFYLTQAPDNGGAEYAAYAETTGTYGDGAINDSRL